MFRQHPPGLALGLVLAVGVILPVALGAEPRTTLALAEAKVKAAQKAYEESVKAIRDGRSDAEKVYVWSRRWLEAQRDADKKADRTAGLKAHRDRMKDLRQTAEALYKLAKAPYAEVAGTEYYLAEAELWLAPDKRE